MEYVFISGGSDRIGKAIAIKLAKLGYNIILHYNSAKEKAEQTQQHIIEKSKVDCKIFQIDFSNNQETKVASDDIFSNYNIKILINSASIFEPSDFEKEGDLDLYRNFTINFVSAYLLTKSFKKFSHSGQIINILDTKISKNETNHLDYILSKKMLHEFTKISAKELAPEIRVNAIAPGIILPPPDKDENYIIKRAQGIPLQKKGNTSFITDAIVSLVNNSFITGQVIFVDGGEHL